MTMHYDTTPGIDASAGLSAQAALAMPSKPKHRFTVECFDADGNLRWSESFDNLVTNAGKAKYISATLKDGLASPSYVVGLVSGAGGSATYAAGDTMGSHAGWTEFTSYSEANRPAWTPGAITTGSPSTVDNSASKAVFTISAAGPVTVGGAFFCDQSTKGGVTGTLMGVGSFAADRIVYLNDTLNVTISASQN